MSDSQPASANRAVFLSYASQDAGAVERIAIALRDAGVEVWFDKSELTGGDAWDAKIRGQIKSCALFVPIISANTNTRREGYFRREWKLAVDRTHDMDEALPFLVPVVIDATTDAGAFVPEKFREVQWTRLPGGETPEKFSARVKKLLGGEAIDAGQVADRPSLQPKHSPATPWLVPAIIGLAAVVALAIWQPWRGSAPARSTVATSTAPVSASVAEIAHVRARIFPERWQKGDFEALSPTLDRLIRADPENSDAWALRSIITSLQVTRNIDSGGTNQLEVGKAAAERALRLAPDSPLAELALGFHFNAMISRGGDAQTARPHVTRALAAMPGDPLARFACFITEWMGFNAEGTERIANEWLAVEPNATYPAWILAQHFITLRRPADAEKWATAATADRYITGTRAFYTLFESKYYLRADLAAAKAALDRVPPEGRAVHRVVHARWLLAMAERRWDEALQDLARVPEPMLYDRTYHGPRALLAGLAHQRAGRADAALAQFRETERLLRVELATDTENEELHLALAVTLACVGRATEARSELGLVEPLLKGRAPSVYWGAEVISIAQTYGALGDFGAMAEWLRKLFVERSGFPFTPASLKFDPRFAGKLDAPEIQALLKEFASLDQPHGTAAAAPDEKSVAVLPFANMSPDKDNEFFADGVHEDVITNLGKIRALKVISRASVLAYRDSASRNLKKIAAELDVATVLEGSVRRAGTKVRVTAQLIDARTDALLWSETYDKDLTDVFAIQSTLAQEIAIALKANLTANERTLIERRMTQNQAAYDFYLRGRIQEASMTYGSTRERFERVIALHQQAARLDPAFLLPYVRLTVLHGRLYFFGYGDPTPERRAWAREAMEAARRVAPEAPETHVAQGSYAYFCDNNWERAAAEFRAAETGLPNDSDLFTRSAANIQRLGRWREAVDFHERAIAVSPADLNVGYTALVNFFGLRRFQQTVDVARHCVALFPDDGFTQLYLIRALYAIDGDRPGYIRARLAMRTTDDDLAGRMAAYERALLVDDFSAAAHALGALERVGFTNVGGTFNDPAALQRAQVAFLRGLPDVAALAADEAIGFYRSKDWTPRQTPFALLGIARAEAYAGRASEAVRDASAAQAQLEGRDAVDEGVLRLETARIDAALNRREDALAGLRKLLAGYCYWSPNEIRYDPFLSRLKDDPRFEEILKSAKPL